MDDIFKLIDGVNEKLGQNEITQELLEKAKTLTAWSIYRSGCIQGEVVELNEAVVDENVVDIIDGFIDIGVFAIGSVCIMLGPDKAREAFERVCNSNMTKKAGFKAERRNKFGMPDMIKDQDYVPSDIEDLIPVQLMDVF